AQLEGTGLLLAVDHLLLQLADAIVKPGHIGPDRGAPGLLGRRLDVPFVLLHLLLDFGDLGEDPLAPLPQERGLVPELIDTGVQPSDPLARSGGRSVVTRRDLAKLGDVGVLLADPPGTSGRERRGRGHRLRGFSSAGRHRDQVTRTRDIAVVLGRNVRRSARLSPVAGVARTAQDESRAPRPGPVPGLSYRGSGP